MGLDLTKLEKIRRRGANTIARCPACAEAGGDHKGEHLFINDNGSFGCVLYPGHVGHLHRQRIFELAGIKETPNKSFQIKKPLSTSSVHTDIQKDILGLLGHIKLSHARKNMNTSIEENNSNIKKDSIETVPTDPKPKMVRQNKILFTSDEVRLLVGIDAESLETVCMIKDIFNGTVVSLV